MRWMQAGGYPVYAHSDLHIETKDWCRRNLERQHWSFDKLTGSYEHTFWFEHQADADRFRAAFPKYTK